MRHEERRPVQYLELRHGWADQHVGRKRTQVCRFRVPGRDDNGATQRCQRGREGPQQGGPRIEYRAQRRIQHGILQPDGVEPRISQAGTDARPHEPVRRIEPGGSGLKRAGSEDQVQRLARVHQVGQGQRAGVVATVERPAGANEAPAETRTGRRGGHQLAGDAGGAGHLPVERERGERRRRRDTEFTRGHRAPWTGRPVYDQVGPGAAEVREHPGQQPQGGPRELFQHREGDWRIRQGQVAPGVEVDLRTSGLNLDRERGGGVVGHRVTTPDELCHDRERWVDVPVHADVEERDGTHRRPPGATATGSRRYRPGPVNTSSSMDRFAESTAASVSRREWLKSQSAGQATTSAIVPPAPSSGSVLTNRTESISLTPMPQSVGRFSFEASSIVKAARRHPMRRFRIFCPANGRDIGSRDVTGHRPRLPFEVVRRTANSARSG
ncbi:hypothetical protein AB395_00003787 [Sinorhizobium fredii CCBAU 45436]|nr:hypothetical protein AB395_00003787 [Sinorhizobium fredii CCBAU 45436]